MSRIDPEIEDCLIRLENQMYGFGGVAGRSASTDRYAVEEHIRDIDGYERDARRENVKLKADIHSLRAERDRLRAKMVKIREVAFDGGTEDDLTVIYSIARRALEGDTTTTPERREG